SSVPKVADDGAANKNLLANQQPPPAPPVVQKPAQNLAQKQPVQIEPPKATVEPKQIAKTPPTAPKPKVVQKCDRLPDVEWWRNKNHLSIRAYVQRKYAGDWVPYIKSWNRRLDKLVDIQKRESSAVASSGVVIAGKDLEEYIEKVEKRITVLKCLAGNKTSS
ncbi:MAG: hypothetical protein HOF23_04565, partial [Rhodospirillaceae bacterium]|nr:hypothetical protein [Rhodospirillaceae bacterium]